MITISKFLHQTIYGNTLEDYLWFVAILMIGLAFKRFFSKLISQGLYRVFRRYGKHIGITRFIDLLSGPLGFFFLLLIVYTACNRLTFPSEWKLVPGDVFGVRFVLSQFFQATMVFSITWILMRVVEFIGLVLILRARKTETKHDDQIIPFVKEGVKVLIAVVGLMIMLAVAFKLDVVSLIAGLGIGGLAIAFAAKETLENLLGSFTIFMDRPFIVGDLVRVGTIEGRVESIGFRSTRIRALDRMQVMLPNKMMVDAALINDSERTMHRAVSILSLAYETTSEQLLAAITDIDKVLEKHPMLDAKHYVRFHEFTPRSLDVRVMYFVNTAELEKFLQVKSEINFAIMEILQKYGCKFATPVIQV